MSDKAERVAKLIWDGVYGNGHVPPIVAANHEKACALIRDYGDERANEAYKIGFDNGYARQKYDADWNRVEANL
jgi:hypothetical protein